MGSFKSCIVGAAALLIGAPAALAEPVFYGPTPYLSFADSPFNPADFSDFYLEDFETGALTVPGVSITATSSSVQSPGGLTDSVDADTGAIDGSGTNAHSFWALGSPGISFTFNAEILGALPSHAGIVWTDGEGQITFEAYGPGNVLLGTIGPVSEPGVFPDSSFFGTTAEDRFFGVSDLGGIERIFIRNSSGGIEVDHLQYGVNGGAAPPPSVPIPLPAAVWMGLSTLGLAGAAGRVHGRRTVVAE